MAATDRSPIPSHARLRVLVVDDNDDTVITLMLLLEDEGHEVRGVHDGKQALVEFAEFEPDVVIVDIGLPKANGWEVARAVRKISGGAGPLMIAISGQYTKSADRVLSEMSGFNYFLSKPFDPNALMALVVAQSCR